jgi:hypothetical protein
MRNAKSKIFWVFLLFWLNCYSLLIASNLETQNVDLSLRIDEFLKLIQTEITSYPYKEISGFLRVTSEYEQPGETWVSKYKEEKAALYKISFRRSKMSGEKIYKFGTLKFVSSEIIDLYRNQHYKTIKTLLEKKYGKPFWDKQFNKGKVVRTLWWLEEKDESKWSLMLVTSGIGEDKGYIEIVLNRKPLKTLPEED